jgi:murein L,D-transpeptidase YcbB/YkuD
LSCALVGGLADADPGATPVEVGAIEQPPQWDIRSSRELLAILDRALSHGLDPSAYRAGRLRAAIAAGDVKTMQSAAETSFVQMALDLANGRLPDDAVAKRFAGGNRLDREAATEMMRDALSTNAVAGTLDELAPRDLQYLKLRNALAALPRSAPAEQRDALVATLERRRWMAREPVGRHLLVNIPAYRIDLVEDGRVIESHRVIVGKRATPTPQFAASVEAVTINPTWSVPASIVAESVGALVRTNPAAARAKGYSWTRSPAGGLSVVQAPGPQNALGRIKFELPNAFHVYIHDTNSRELFERSERALSHGCIRLAEPTALAATVLADAGWDDARIRTAVEAGRTVRVPLRRTIPVSIVYFTAEPAPDGSTRYWPDIYGLDHNLARRAGGTWAPAVALGRLETECSGSDAQAG